ncbi:MAG: oligosaccharide flippase family protein [Sedimentibacter saalensis]|nr:oligosaccharide flippase family protein [Sedimentibacter saalensis]
MKKSTAVNFIYNMIYQISLVILPLITSPYLSRVIGPDGLGKYSYAYSTAYYFYMFAMLGINNYGNRTIAAIRDNKNEMDHSFSRIYYFQILSSVFSTVIYGLYCFFTNTQLAFVQIFYVASAILDINWFYFGIEEFKITVIRKTVIKIITTCCIFMFVKSVGDLITYALIIAIGELLGQAYMWFYIPKFIHFKKVPFKDIISGTKEILVLFIPIIATSIYRYMDKIMLGTLGTMNDVGQYDYAEKIIMICLGCMTALGTVMLPKMANLIANNKIDEMQRYLRNSMQFAMMMAFPITFGLAAVSHRLALVYLGEGYEKCGEAMLFLSLTVIPIAWANVIRTQYLIPNSKDKEYVVSVIIAAVANFILNFCLIPQYGLNGAMVGTITAEFSVAIIQTLYIRKNLPISKYLKDSIGFYISGVVMYFIVRLVLNVTNDNILGLIIAVAVGTVSYVFFVGLTAYFSKNFIYNMIKDRFVKDI